MKTIKVVNKQIARDLPYNEKEVAQINDFFWKEVKSKLIALETPTLYLKEIGTITISHYKLNRAILMLIRQYRAIDHKSVKPETKVKWKGDIMVQLRKCLRFRNILATEEYEYTKRYKSLSTESN